MPEPRILTLDEWRLRQHLTYRELGALIMCNVGMAYAYCLDPRAAEFRLPRSQRMARIYEISNGEVGPASFYKLPRLTQPFDPKAPQLPLENAA